MHDRPRAALLLSGHLRQACNSQNVSRARTQLFQHVASCRATFRCDVFLHTWTTVDAATAKWSTGQLSRQASESSYQCLDEITGEIAPTATAVEVQDLKALSSQVLRRGLYFKPALVATRMNLHGMAATVQMMNAHAATMNLSYAIAVRMRVDMGARFSIDHHLSWINITQGWALVRARANALSPQSPRTLHGCRRFSPGVKNGDNCFWGVAAVLSDVVLRAKASTSAGDRICRA